MTRCNEFYEKVERDGNFCGLSESSYNEVKQYIEFIKSNTELSALTEKAAKPLIREKDPVVKAKAIEKVTKRLKDNAHKKTDINTVNRIVETVKTGKIVSGRPKKPQDPVTSSLPEVEDEHGDDADRLDVEEDYYSGDMPDTPDTQEEPKQGSEKTYEWGGVLAPKEVEDAEDQIDEQEEGPIDREITQKVVKEYLRNAGHEDKLPKPARTPSGDEKQAIFEKCIKQALEWGMDGDEIARRMKKAIMYVYPRGLGGENQNENST